MNQNQLLNQKLLLNQTELLKQTQLLNQLNRRVISQRYQSKTPRERIIQQQEPIQEEDQESSTTPVYTIISVPFLARSLLPNPSVKQVQPKTNGLVKQKQVLVNANGKNTPIIYLSPEQQENSLAHLNLLNQQQQQLQRETSNQLNTTTAKSINTRPTNLNTTKTPITTLSATMMGIQLPGNEFQDMSGALPIAAVEEFMTPEYLDDCFNETNNNSSDFDANIGTHKLHGLNEMTINQMNVDYADQLQTEDGHEEPQQFMENIEGEEFLFNMLRLPHSEELVSLTQPSIEHETLESEKLFTQQNIDTSINNNNSITNGIIASFSEDSDNSSSYIAISPGSPLPTENDCIATSELHNFKYRDANLNTLQDIETYQPLNFTPPSSIENSPLSRSESMIEEKSEDLDQILNLLLSSSQQVSLSNLKRNSNHLSDSPMKVAKKSRHNIPTMRLAVNTGYANGLSNKVPDTPEVCDMVDSWLTEDFSLRSTSSSPSWCETTTLLPSDLPCALIEPKFENPPSVASSYICDESLYAAPSPSDSSGYTFYSTNPNSPAASSSGRKARGRPPKQHSDLPDPEILQNLSETDRKRYEDRCKNNEASRQSRQKNKEKQMSLQADEDREQRKHDELTAKLKKLDLIKDKLQKALFANLERK